MNNFNPIAVATAISAIFISASPSAAGRLYSLKYNIGISKNDSNPRLVISDGSRLKVLMLEENKNPLTEGGYGYMKSYFLPREGQAALAEMLYRDRNCVDTLGISERSNIGDVYERAMGMFC